VAAREAERKRRREMGGRVMGMWEFRRMLKCQLMNRFQPKRICWIRKTAIKAFKDIPSPM
jgi:hypothetical protein